MAITQATSLADFSTGIGTAGAVLQVDNVDGQVGIGTTDPQGTLQVGIAITMDGTAGVITASSFSGSGGNLSFTGADISAATGTFTGNVSVGGTLTYEDVTNIDAVGIVTARTGLEVTANGLVINAGVSTFAADLSIADKIIHTGDTNTAIRFPAADTFSVETSGSERLRVNSSGNIGINSTTPRSKLHVANGNSGFNPGNPTGLGAGAVASLESNSDVALQFLTSTTTDNFIYFGDTDSATTGSIQYDHNTNALSFNVNGGTERLRIDSSGRLLVGSTSARANFNNATRTAYLQLEGTSGTNIDSSSIALIYNQDSTGNASNIYFGKTRGSSDGDNTALNATGDRLGNISFQGNDGTQFVDAAHIRAFTDGTPGADDMPARLVFSTNSGTTSPTERLRIDSGGRVIIGGTSNSGSSSVGSYGNAGLQLNSTTAALTNINLINRNGSGTTHALVFAKARDGGANGGRVQEDDDFGAISFQGFGGTGDANYRAGAEIRGASDGTPGSSDMPGRLEFWTCPDGTASMSERLRIDSRGSFQFSNGFMNETVNINTTARNGTQAVNLDDGMVHYFQSSSTGTWKPNFTMSSGNDINATIATGDTFSVTMIVNKGNTAHFANAIQVDGSDVTPDWSGGAPTDGGGNNTWDIYHYTIIKTGDDTFKCWASVSTYEP